MYSGPYGFSNNAGAAFNGSPPQPSHHIQPGSGPSQPQQMMYNPQQFPMGAQGGFSGTPNMMPGAVSAGMMQNPAMAHMANNQMGYQTPYGNSPYGTGVPASAAPQSQMAPNFNMVSGPGGASSFGLPPLNMAQQQQQQQQSMHRMQPGQQSSAVSMGGSTPQRPLSTGLSGAGNSLLPQQPQQQQAQHQVQQQQQQPHQQTPASQSIQSTPQSQTIHTTPQHKTTPSTPQTPTFPSGTNGSQVNGASSAAGSLSPGGGSKAKAIFTVLLDINQELLYEAIQLQNTQMENKRECDSAHSGAEPRKPSDEEHRIQADYIHCMKRLQGNLAYLAAAADRKASVQAPKGPGILSAPPLNLAIKMKGSTDHSSADFDPNKDREERDQYMKGLYTKLQSFYPGIDPKKEPAFAPPVPNANQSTPGGAAASRSGAPQGGPAAMQQRPVPLGGMPGQS